jgi:diadenosine tetraphosphatase ApaH/serine/threonine PP2A family protein phosphatase
MWIRGNGERWTAGADDAPENVRDAIRACRSALGEADVAALAALPERARVGEALAVHGSPVSDVRSFFPQPAEDEAELLEGISVPRLYFGHTHLQFTRTAGGTELVNPGSVGMPLDGDTRAAYALVHEDGSIEPRRVAYDNAVSVAAVRENFGEEPWTEVIAGRIEHARFDG